jgi:hypothetical protein
MAAAPPTAQGARRQTQARRVLPSVDQFLEGEARVPQQERGRGVF